MKSILTGLVLATASAIGFASNADASPTGIASIPVLQGHGHVSVGFGTGWGYGGGYGYSGGYYRTTYQWVQQTVFVGYDGYGNPMYSTTWVQQPVQVWVPYVRPYGGVTVGFGYHWH